MFAFQRADSIRPALNSSVDRHSTDQEDTETVTQVIWHQNGQKAQLEAAQTDWFCMSPGCKELPVCFSFCSSKESALK